MNVQHLFYASYWFSQPNLVSKSVEATYVIILLGCILAGIVALIIRRSANLPQMRQLMTRYASCGISMGFIGLLLFYFREQHVYFLGWRMWFLMWSVTLAVWVYRLLSYHCKRIPVIMAAKAEREFREQYLPKK